MTDSGQRDDADLLQRVAADLRQPVSLDPEFDVRVMQRVRAAPNRLVPAWGIRALVAAGLAAILLGGAIAYFARRGHTAVTFTLVNPAARSVAVVGDFNDWDLNATPLRRQGPEGTWTVRVIIPPGSYAYAFVINGDRWVPDPAAARVASEDFGVPNSVIMVAGT